MQPDHQNPALAFDDEFNKASPTTPKQRHILPFKNQSCSFKENIEPKTKEKLIEQET